MIIRLQQVRRGVALLFMVLLTAAVNAVPAKPGLTRLLTLTDGTTVKATLVGDEHGHYWLGADGQAYQASERADAFQLVDKADVTMRAQARRSFANQRRIRHLAPRRVGEVGAITGKKKGLIILVNFSNVAFQSANNNALYQRIANEKNFSYGKFKGSMSDYFYAQSDGQFELTFDVVGPVTVSNTQSYYGSNDSYGDDKHPAEMVIEALKKADSTVNFADYDWNGDGEVEQVYVVYAGKGEADGGASTTIWPHEYSLSAANYYGDGSGPQTLDGVTIDTYACGAELNGQTGSIAGIGTMCHEFSHCLGYPDFYDTDYSGGQGMGNWDLMDSGSYNGDGYQPAGYTSYERWVAGWKEPIELEVTQSITNMKALTNGGESYVIYNQGHPNEYFLLENRQQSGWDSGIPGAGLLILHVDYDEYIWAENKPNDTPSHQRMTWIPADNEYQYTTYQGTKYYSEEGMANDPFPYGSVNAFNKSTTPAAKFYNKNTDGTYYLDSSIEYITCNADGTVSFRFKSLSNVATPKFSLAAGRYRDSQTVSITCTTEGAAIYYTLDGTTPSPSSFLYSQPITISETTTLKALAVLEDEESHLTMAAYEIGGAVSNPDTKQFKLVTSTSELEDGFRYIIACGSKATAAGGYDSSKKFLKSQSVTVKDDIITITDDVDVFILEETTGGWAFLNEASNQYLYSEGTKKLGYSRLPDAAWTLANGTNGVIMTYQDYGTMLYNVNYSRFTTYTSKPNAAMIQANLYMEYTETLKGDVNDDGKVTIADAVALVNYLLGQSSDEFNEQAAYVDDDDAITISDALAIVSMVLNQ